jgi:hypothetical protein
MKITEIPNNWKKSDNDAHERIKRVNNKTGKESYVWQRHPFKICPSCKELFVNRDPRVKTCSTTCRKNFFRASRTHTWNGGQIIDRGYRLVYMPKHPMANRGRDHSYVLEHRLIMSQQIGRILKKTEHVHHKNENKLDNRIENLQLMSCSEHIKHHRLLDNKKRKRNEMGRLI